MIRIEQEIIQMEAQLRQAMLVSDVAALELLIADDLLFTDHLGHVLTKQEDLSVYRSGKLKFSQLTASELLVRSQVYFAVVSVRMAVVGSFGDQFFAADLRYTRIWRKEVDGLWRVTAGHSCLIAA